MDEIRVASIDPFEASFDEEQVAARFQIILEPVEIKIPDPHRLFTLIGARATMEYPAGFVLTFKVPMEASKVVETLQKEDVLEILRDVRSVTKSQIEESLSKASTAELSALWVRAVANSMDQKSSRPR